MQKLDKSNNIIMKAKQFIFFILLLPIILFSCTQKKEIKEKPHILCTTQMVADLAKNICDTFCEIQCLMGPGVDPHLYKMVQGDLQKIEEADIIFYNGLHLEGKLQDVFEALSKTKKVIEVSKNIQRKDLLIAGKRGEHLVYDPHIWHAVSLWQQCIEIMQNEISIIDKEHKENYIANTKKLQMQLDSLHQWVKNNINEIPKNQRVLITSHDAFTYYGKYYDIEVKALQGISTVSEIGLKDIQNLVNFIVHRNIKAVFVESSVSSKTIESLVEACASKKHKIKIGGTLFSDAMGNDNSNEGTYIGMIKFNTKTIIENLK